MVGEDKSPFPWHHHKYILKINIYLLKWNNCNWCEYFSIIKKLFIFLFIYLFLKILIFIWLEFPNNISSAYKSFITFSYSLFKTMKTGLLSCRSALFKPFFIHDRPLLTKKFFATLYYIIDSWYYINTFFTSHRK